jgi:hypothetical protein
MIKSIANDINFEALQREIDEAEDYLVRRSVTPNSGLGGSGLKSKLHFV